jgi:hypothetical protein
MVRFIPAVVESQHEQRSEVALARVCGGAASAGEDIELGARGGRPGRAASCLRSRRRRREDLEPSTSRAISWTGWPRRAAGCRRPATVRAAGARRPASWSRRSTVR